MSSSKADRPGRLWIALFGGIVGGVAFAALTSTLLGSVGLLGGLQASLELSHWGAVLRDRSVWVALGYSLALAAATMACSLALALVLAPALVRAPGGSLDRGLVPALLLLPLAFPGVAAATVSILLLGDSGWLSRLVYGLGGIEAPAEFPPLIYDRAGIGIVLTHCAMVTPFFVLMIDRLRTLERMDELAAIGRTLGATSRQTWLRIRLPVLRRGLLPVCSVYTAALITAYEVPLLLGARYPSVISVEIERRLNPLDLSLRPQAYAQAALYLLLLIAAWALLRNPLQTAYHGGPR